MKDLETYLLDQFPLRDGFRTLKAALRTRVFLQKETNGYYLFEGGISKIESEIKENEILFGAKKINEICKTYLSGKNAWYAIIPDKGYFTAEQSGVPALDYDRLVALMNENVTEARYINLFDSLTLADYYRTDTHWRQERLFPVAKTLAEAMGIPLAGEVEYSAHTLSPFWGVYAAHSALSVEPDTLMYLTSPATEAAIVTSVEAEGALRVYTTERFWGMDGYDVYLSGAAALLTIENQNAKTDRELIIFRDSFGSSIAPLLIDSYRKITLVDLRYFSSALLEQYLEFRDQDVLFLYSTSLLNSAMLLK